MPGVNRPGVISRAQITGMCRADFFETRSRGNIASVYRVDVLADANRRVGTMLKRSPEIEAVVERWLAAHSGKQGRPLINMLSKSEPLRYLGFAPDEYWAGSLLRPGLAQHISEVPDWNASGTIVEAFEMNDVGWAIWPGNAANSGLTTRSVSRCAGSKVSAGFHACTGTGKRFSRSRRKAAGNPVMQPEGSYFS